MNFWLNQYPFSAHVVQHLLLALVLPAVLLLATPSFDLGALKKLERVLGQPPVSWILGVATMLAWHIPVLFNAALASNGLHVFQLVSFVITGTIFWWPILGPQRDRRLNVLASVSYLFSACLSCTILGAYLTFGPPGLYGHHAANGDQQLGGLLMWVPGCFVYLSAILVAVRKWFGQERTA